MCPNCQGKFVTTLWGQEVARRAASGTKSVRLLVATVRNDVPEFCLTNHLDAGLVRKCQVRAVPCATSALAIKALAMVLKHSFIRNFIANRTAGAAAGIGI
jgi:hypothetical protein